jgi:hypothetical protein
MGRGREAVTVRQAILVIVLVAASFSGGAFVNGPGLHWAKPRLLRLLDLSNEGEIASVNLKVPASTETVADGSGSATPVAQTRSPATVVSSVSAEGEPSEHDTSDRYLMSQPQSKSKSGTAGASRFELSAASVPAPTKRHSPALTKTLADVSPPLDSHIAPANAVSSITSTLSDSQETPAILDSLAALLPATSPVPDPSPRFPARSSSAPKLIGDGGDEWTVLERKMQSLGVSRFMIEAEPGGRVVFSCLIPLAGRQAVAQRFEAEGDDLIQAARATLQRLGLWLATQPTSN